MATPSSLFKGQQFDVAIIILCVRWYITYKLSYRDLRDIMAERGVELLFLPPHLHRNPRYDPAV